jgi:hypothetical protein
MEIADPETRIPAGRFHKWGRRVAIGMIGIYICLLPWEMYRRIWQIHRADISVSSATLAPGTTVSIDVVTSGEVRNRVVLELIQDQQRHTLLEFHGELNRMNMWDVRTYRYERTVTLTREVLARFKPGAAVIELTGYGGTKLLRTPPPVVRQQQVVVRGPTG